MNEQTRKNHTNTHYTISNSPKIQKLYICIRRKNFPHRLISKEITVRQKTSIVCVIFLRYVPLLCSSLFYYSSYFIKNIYVYVLDVLSVQNFFIHNSNISSVYTYLCIQINILYGFSVCFALFLLSLLFFFVFSERK